MVHLTHLFGKRKLLRVTKTYKTLNLKNSEGGGGVKFQPCGLCLARFEAVFVFCGMSLREDSRQCGGVMMENENNDIKVAQEKKCRGKSGEKAFSQPNILYSTLYHRGDFRI